MITETTWFLTVLWVILLVVGFKERIVGIFGSVVGIFYGLHLINAVAIYVALPIICLSLYVMFTLIFQEDKK